MTRPSRSRYAFSLVEVTSGVLVGLTLLAIGVPMAIQHQIRGKEQEANRNAAAILRAVKHLSSEYGGDYLSPHLSKQQIQTALGGLIPINPCTGDRDLFVDYGFERERDVVILKPASGPLCDPALLAEVWVERL